MMYKQVIVVEGSHDEAKIKSIFKDITVITTNGMEIKNETIKLLQELSKTHQIVLFLDPDGPGEKIRNKISSNVDNCYHAFIQKNKCISKNNRKIGIEHANKEDIIESLLNLLEEKSINSDIDFALLFKYKLVGNKNSQKLREQVSTYFNIGYPNAKTFLKRLILFNITKTELLEYLNTLK